MQNDWNLIFNEEKNKPYYKALQAFLDSERSSGKTIYPPENEWFNAFEKTAFNSVKVVIIGQDPYHGEGEAHGLCFSVNKGIKIPPSLRNIYKELASDIGFIIPNHGNLSAWAEQGVLLMNATLTVRANEAGSHQKKGWEIFTDSIIQNLNAKKDNLVFLLWGNFARSKKSHITRHNVLESAHPSPLSAYNGFFGCRHFSQTNALLVEKGIEPIDWQIV